MLNGDHYVVNGQKIWTSFAHWADMIACLDDPAGYGSWLVPVWSGVVG